MTGAFLEVRDLHVDFPTDDGIVRAVAGASFSVAAGETMAIVGESGSGKSVTAQAVMGLLNPRAAQISGHVLLDGTDLLECDPDDVRRMRGSVMSMIFQDPLSSLHPYFRIGDQLVEAVRVHQKVSKSQARELAIDGLRRVVDDPDSLIRQTTPDELEGLMRDGTIAGGMIPKVESCVHAVRNGVKRAHILDGRVPHVLLLELLTFAGIGTMVESSFAGRSAS